MLPAILIAACLSQTPHHELTEDELHALLPLLVEGPPLTVQGNFNRPRFIIREPYRTTPGTTQPKVQPGTTGPVDYERRLKKLAAWDPDEPLAWDKPGTAQPPVQKSTPTQKPAPARPKAKPAPTKQRRGGIIN